MALATEFRYWRIVRTLVCFSATLCGSGRHLDNTSQSNQ